MWIAGSGHKLMVEKKLHGVLSRARLVRSRVPGFQTGAPARVVAQPAFIGPPHSRVGNVVPSRDIVWTSGGGGYPS